MTTDTADADLNTRLREQIERCHGIVVHMLARAGDSDYHPEMYVNLACRLMRASATAAMVLHRVNGGATEHRVVVARRRARAGDTPRENRQTNGAKP